MRSPKDTTMTRHAISDSAQHVASAASPALQTCSRCIYDTTIPYITFDQQGVCNYCIQHDELDRQYPTGEEGLNQLKKLAAEIKAAGRGKKYDVVVGVSGGCDSSYVLHLCKELGLRPLAAHFDNTWNSKTAVENIQTVLEALKVDLYTHVVDNEEFCDLFRAFFRASVPDVDTPSDIGFATTLYMAAAQHGIKYIFDGHAFRTEGLSPQGWFYMDARYVDSVHKEFGEIKRLQTFPNLYLRKWLWWISAKKIRRIRPLYWIDYRKEEAKKLLAEQYGWQWYGGHHMENRTSYFTNNYYLPKKFSIDLRYCEYSALVRSGQMSRATALQQIQLEKPFDSSILQEFKKRLKLSDDEFDKTMQLPTRSYRDFQTHKKTFEKYKFFFWVLCQLDLVPRSFYVKFTKKYD